MRIYKTTCWCGTKPLDELMHEVWHRCGGGTTDFKRLRYQITMEKLRPRS